MSRFGRRTVYIAGQLSMASVLGVIGILGCVEQKTEVSLAIGSLMVVLNFLFNITVGPTCEPIGENSNVALRYQAIPLLESFLRPEYERKRSCLPESPMSYRLSASISWLPG